MTNCVLRSRHDRKKETEMANTLIEDGTLCESVAVTFTLLKGEVANARQISAVPAWVLVLLTSVQLNPAPVTPVTVVFVPDR